MSLFAQMCFKLNLVFLEMAAHFRGQSKVKDFLAATWSEWLHQKMRDHPSYASCVGYFETEAKKLQNNNLLP